MSLMRAAGIKSHRKGSAHIPILRKDSKTSQTN